MSEGTHVDDDFSDHYDGSLGAARRAEVGQIVHAAIASLEEDHRLVVVLRDIEELSYEEICQITGLPEGTVKSRLHRARLALRKKMMKHR